MRKIRVLIILLMFFSTTSFFDLKETQAMSSDSFVEDFNDFHIDTPDGFSLQLSRHYGLAGGMFYYNYWGGGCSFIRYSSSPDTHIASAEGVFRVNVHLPTSGTGYLFEICTPDFFAGFGVHNISRTKFKPVCRYCNKSTGDYEEYELDEEYKEGGYRFSIYHNYDSGTTFWYINKNLIYQNDGITSFPGNLRTYISYHACYISHWGITAITELSFSEKYNLVEEFIAGHHISEIAEAYKPYMYFYKQGDDEEKFRPTIVQDMLDNSGFWKHEKGIPPQVPPKRTKLKDPPVSEEYISGFQNTPFEYYFLDLLNDESGDLKSEMIGLESAPNTVYAHINIDEYEGKKYIVAQYWFHYLYNYFSPDNHEGEWEMIEVLIDYNKFQQFGINTIPEGAAYSRHIGGEYREWEDIEAEKDDQTGKYTHPVVYVARGSHAAYFEEGRYYLEIANIPVFPNFDNVNSGTELKESEPIALENQSWLNFGGNWGYVRPSVMGDGPEGPKYKGDKWYEPADWAFTTENPAKKIEFPSFNLSLSCPADMFITNSEGQITGTKDGEFIHEIPDSYVNSLGEEEIYLAPANDVYNIEIHGIGDGTFNFLPEFSSWNESRVFGYTNVSVNPNTIAYSEIDPNMTDYELKIDYNGDGSIDETVTPDIGLSLSSPNVIQPLRLNTTLNYNIEIKNEGDQEDTFNLEYKIPEEWNGSFSQDIVTLGPKETKIITFSVNVPEAEIKDYKMRITAFSDDGLNALMSLIASTKSELTVSDLTMTYNEKEFLLSCDVSNIGLMDAENVLVRFYNGKPENNNIIGEKTIDLASGETKNLSISWNPEDGIYNIYAVIDPNNKIEESLEYNNIVFRQFRYSVPQFIPSLEFFWNYSIDLKDDSNYNIIRKDKEMKEIFLNRGEEKTLVLEISNLGVLPLNLKIDVRGINCEIEPKEIKIEGRKKEIVMIKLYPEKEGIYELKLSIKGNINKNYELRVVIE